MSNWRSISNTANPSSFGTPGAGRTTHNPQDIRTLPQGNRNLDVSVVPTNVPGAFAVAGMVDGATGQPMQPLSLPLVTEHDLFGTCSTSDEESSISFNDEDDVRAAHERISSSAEPSHRSEPPQLNVNILQSWTFHYGTEDSNPLSHKRTEGPKPRPSEHHPRMSPATLASLSRPWCPPENEQPNKLKRKHADADPQSPMQSPGRTVDDLGALIACESATDPVDTAAQNLTQPGAGAGFRDLLGVLQRWTPSVQQPFLTGLVNLARQPGCDWGQLAAFCTDWAAERYIDGQPKKYVVADSICVVLQKLELENTHPGARSLLALLALRTGAVPRPDFRDVVLRNLDAPSTAETGAARADVRAHWNAIRPSRLGLEARKFHAAVSARLAD